MTETAESEYGHQVARPAELRRSPLKVVTPARPMGAAALTDRPSGIRASASTGAIVISAKPPSYAQPGTFRFSQTMKSPCRQGVQ